ncbi:F-box protein: endocytic membrane traffic, recycling ReCYcling 1 [Lunasporangiospora selenospora]|uniref:F-box protein: endocytic membrane traffic, recycling ReCYcling 1 n=1 Tax=Lunasporangiospora selenospora TaxID=979761 RepID=A0A9P6FPX8_9FUNG|nr:F-box protein: endocytic membrane traffic, recycling ReCYcling 1 [Lunasporangiospora selenospora]
MTKVQHSQTASFFLSLSLSNRQYELWLAQPIVVRENTAFPEFTPLRLFMEFTELEFQKQAIIIHDVFPEEADVLYNFAERVFEDVISEYCSQLFDMCSMRDKLLYLKSVPTAYRYLERLDNTIVTMEPIHLPTYRMEKLLARVFAPWLEQYLKNELDWVQKSCKDQIDKHDRQRDQKKDEPKRMNPRNREVFKRNFLKGFRNVITLPYKISSSIVAGVTSSSSTPAPSGNAALPPVASSSASTHSTTTIASTTTTPATASSKSSKRFSIRSITSISSTSTSATTTAAPTIASAPDTPTSSSSPTFAPERKSVSLASDADSIRTFATAIQQLGKYRPTTQHESGGVTPLMDFFELVHVVDLILQMVLVYYAEEMCKYIDKMDFLNEANKEKKAFERMIDDGVAAGLDKSIEVLIGQVEYILTTMQQPTDYNPEEGADIELQPTLACKEAVQCLTTHTKMLIGCTDKHTLDVFFQEIGLRLFNCLTKHLRSNVVSSHGGFVLICDLNYYYNFVVSLKQPSLLPNFLALKELGNIFIIQSPQDLKQLIHDMERFGGILRIEDIFEFAEMRSDWKSIQRIVERDRLDCIIM